jgi:lipopolysaccharide exporter
MMRDIAKGAAWMVLFRLVDRSIGIISTSILARLLLPADFGLVAMAMSIIALIELATAFSFEIALIQKPEPERTHYDTAWTLNIFVAGGGAVLTAALAYPAAAFFGDPRLAPVMFAIGAAWFASGFENVGTVNFRRQMDFAAEFRLMASKRMITFVVTMIAAITLHSYWALVIGMSTGKVAGVALSYLMQPFRPRFSLRRARELFSFSGWMLANNMAAVVASRVPHFAVGRYFGAQSLGAYTVGSEIAQIAHTELIAPINRALFPGYSRLINDPVAFRRTCIDATAVILLIVLPVSIGVAVVAEQIVRVLLGSQWGEAAPIIQILALSGAAMAVSSNNVQVFLALGRPHLFTLVLVTRLVLLAAMMLFLSTRYGVTGLAFAELFASVGSLGMSLPLLFKGLQLRAGEYFASFWRPLIASCVMGAAVHLTNQAAGVPETFLMAVLELLLSVPVGAASYLVSLWLLWWVSGRPESVETMLGRRALQMLKKLTTRTPSAASE